MIVRELVARLGLDIDQSAFVKGTMALAGLRGLIGEIEDNLRATMKQAQDVADFGEKIDQLSEAAGVNTDAMQAMTKAAAVEGVELDRLGRFMARLSQSMEAARIGGRGSVASFRSIGVEAVDAAGNLRPVMDVLGDVADRFAAMPAGAEKSAAAMRLFGRGGQEMVQILGGGRAALQAFVETSIMSPQQIQDAKAFVHLQRQVKQEMADIEREGVAPLLPVLRDALSVLRQWVQENRELVKLRIRFWLEVAAKGGRALAQVLRFVSKQLKFVADNWQGFVAIFVGLLLRGMLPALAALDAAMIQTGILAVRTAISSAAAWLSAAAPFLAVAAAVGALLLVFDDLRAYDKSIEQGGKGTKTIYGRIKMGMEGIFSLGEGKKPFLLQMLDNLLYTITHIDEVVKELKQDLTDLATFKTIGKTLLGNFAASMTSGGVDGDYKPVAPQAGPGGNVVNTRISMPVQVTAAPGQSAQDVADVVVQQIRDYMTGEFSDAAAALGP